jgi:hypothetical protein
VHIAAIKRLSKPLSVLVDGPMSEAQSGSAILEDTEEHTFVRFCQFAYSGNYDAAEPEIPLGSPAIDAADAVNGEWEIGPEELTVEVRADRAAQEAFWGAPFAPRMNPPTFGPKPSNLHSPQMEKGPAPTGRSKTSNLWELFKVTMYGCPSARFQPPKNTDKYEDYTKVFLCHAQLYVFADKYDIASLRDLSLFKLHKTLSAFTLYPERVGDIVELIQFTYANTTDGPHGEDELKHMVIRYSTCIIEDLAKDPGFQLLLGESSTLSQDIILQMLERLP